MPRIESTHLVTLSEFVEQIKNEESTFSSQNAIDIINYNDFLNKESSLEEIQDICINNLSLFCDINSRMYFENKYFKYYFELAELTKDNPLRFRNMSIYYEPYNIEE